MGHFPICQFIVKSELINNYTITHQYVLIQMTQNISLAIKNNKKFISVYTDDKLKTQHE